MSFELTILGCASATPTLNTHPTAHHLVIGDEHLLVDCGEGTQLQLFRYRIKYNRISYIFISHLHGDHYLGLAGLIMTMNLNKRVDPLHILGPAPLAEIIELQLKYSNTYLNFDLKFSSLNPVKSEMILDMEDFTVETLILKHRIETTGFIFREKEKKRKLNVEACDRYNIPFTLYNDIKSGASYTTPGGKVISNDELSFPGKDPRSYAYCSDTIYDPSLTSQLKGVDILYHEATFLQDLETRAKETFHSTAYEAGLIAAAADVKKLIIGHFSARYDNHELHLEEAKRAFSETELAIEGKRYWPD